jgi:hypothetical protein
MSFPSDIKGCMKDCILAILWPRQAIKDFFRDNGCSADDLKRGLGNRDNETRSSIVDDMFAYLSSKPDSGLGQFRTMLQVLLTWSHFDPYYFETLKKLDRSVALKRIEHLRQLQEIRDAALKQERERRLAGQMATQKARVNCAALKTEFLALFAGSDLPQKRGYKLESILADLARLSSLETTEPFRVSGEQIDGAFKFDGEHYLLEAKWHARGMSNEPVYQFVGKIEGKMYGRGVFVSVHGFSPNVVGDLVKGKAIKTVLADAEDLVFILEERLNFSEMIDAKVRAAQTKGLVYVNPLTGRSKQPKD